MFDVAERGATGAASGRGNPLAGRLRFPGYIIGLLFVQARM
jgi:hypothetical protein